MEINVEDVPDSQPVIEIQFVGWTWNVPWIRVFIDGERVGFLKDKTRGRSRWPRAFAE